MAQTPAQQQAQAQQQMLLQQQAEDEAREKMAAEAQLTQKAGV
jgi:hypothetical protein